MDFELFSVSKLKFSCKNERDSQRNPEPHFLAHLHWQNFFSLSNIEILENYMEGPIAETGLFKHNLLSLL